VPWTVDNELITRTLKVKRTRIKSIFASNFERWARMGRAVTRHEQ